MTDITSFPEQQQQQQQSIDNFDQVKLNQHSLDIPEIKNTENGKQTFISRLNKGFMVGDAVRSTRDLIWLCRHLRVTFPGSIVPQLNIAIPGARVQMDGPSIGVSSENADSSVDEVAMWFRFVSASSRLSQSQVLRMFCDKTYSMSVLKNHAKIEKVAANHGVPIDCLQKLGNMDRIRLFLAKLSSSLFLGDKKINLDERVQHHKDASNAALANARMIASLHSRTARSYRQLDQMVPKIVASAQTVIEDDDAESPLSAIVQQFASRQTAAQTATQGHLQHIKDCTTAVRFWKAICGGYYDAAEEYRKTAELVTTLSVLVDNAKAKADTEKQAIRCQSLEQRLSAAIALEADLKEALDDEAVFLETVVRPQVLGELFVKW